MSIDVRVIDDHAVVRHALALLIEQEEDLHVRGQAGTLAEAQSLVLGGKIPDGGEGSVIVCDISLPDGSGIALAGAARKELPRLGIVVLTMHDDDENLLRALDAGASALVHKSQPAEQVIDAIRSAAAHPTSFTAEGLPEALRRSRDVSRPSLTPREAEVLSLLAEGASIAEVGRRLYMSESTAKTHVARIYAKLEAHNRASAVMAAIRLGLLEG